MFSHLSFGLFAQAAQGANNAAAAANAANGSGGWMRLLIFIGIVVLAYLTGRLLSSRLRMLDHGWKITLVTFVLLASAWIVATGTVKLGIDLAGGAIFVYEYEPKQGQDFSTDRLIGAIRERIDPAGVQQITIRPFGENQIEIIVPEIPAAEVEQLKNKIENLGELEFLITANERDHASIIETATQEGAPNNVVLDGQLLASWVPIKESKKTLAEFTGSSEYFTRTGPDGKLQVLVVRPRDKNEAVTGYNLDRVEPILDPQGRASLSFHFDAEGGRRFTQLTRRNQPSNDGGREFRRHLAVVLNGQIASAPTINAVIGQDGVIEGDFSKQERDDLVAVLNAGALPAELEPIRSRFVDATLGEDMVRRGEISIIASLAAVLLFMLVYYRFAGLIACAALALNILLILALMISIKAAFTLAGLAGLVLTVGMAVDANVLIYERMREELERGAALRMAIRNGFGRATTTIVDANVTTLITAIVLYTIGTDELRGFAIILILGILMSMFTAIFCSRLIFDIAEKSRWITTLNMMSLVRNANFDFMGKQRISFTISLVLIVAGLVAVAARGRSILGIDFTGGTSAEVLFRAGETMTISEVRADIDGTEGWNAQLGSATRDTLGTVVGPTVDHRIRETLERQGVLPRSIILVTAEAEEDGKEIVQLDLPAPKPISEFTEAEWEAYRQAAMLPDMAISEITQIQEVDPRKHYYLNTSNTDGNVVEAILTKLFTGQLATNSMTGPSWVAETSTASPIANPKIESDETAPSFDPRTSGFTAELTFAELIGHDALLRTLQQAASEVQETTPENAVAIEATNPDYKEGGTAAFSQWNVEIGASDEAGRQIVQRANQILLSQPYFPATDNIQGSVAARTAGQAIGAIFASFLGIVIYLWIRFQRVSYGLAAVLALVHDVLITLGAVAASAYLVGIPFIDPFKMSLDMIAAFLTIIGYSINDTIVVFDRIREVRGKNSRITPELVNRSINQTLSRTLLTSITTLIVTVILFFFAGQAIHGFAFALSIGIFVGTYSSIFIASPMLLWMTKPSREGQVTLPSAARPQPTGV